MLAQEEAAAQGSPFSNALYPDTTNSSGELVSFSSLISLPSLSPPHPNPTLGSSSSSSLSASVSTPTKSILEQILEADGDGVVRMLQNHLKTSLNRPISLKALADSSIDWQELLKTTREITNENVNQFFQFSQASIEFLTPISSSELQRSPKWTGNQLLVLEILRNYYWNDFPVLADGREDCGEEADAAEEDLFASSSSSSSSTKREYWSPTCKCSLLDLGQSIMGGLFGTDDNVLKSTLAVIQQSDQVRSQSSMKTASTVDVEFRYTHMSLVQRIQEKSDHNNNNNKKEKKTFKGRYSYDFEFYNLNLQGPVFISIPAFPMKIQKKTIGLHQYDRSQLASLSDKEVNSLEWTVVLQAAHRNQTMVPYYTSLHLASDPLYGQTDVPASWGQKSTWYVKPRTRRKQQAGEEEEEEEEIIALHLSSSSSSQLLVKTSATTPNQGIENVLIDRNQNSLLFATLSDFYSAKSKQLSRRGRRNIWRAIRLPLENLDCFTQFQLRTESGPFFLKESGNTLLKLTKEQGAWSFSNTISKFNSNSSLEIQLVRELDLVYTFLQESLSIFDRFRMYSDKVIDSKLQSIAALEEEGVWSSPSVQTLMQTDFRLVYELLQTKYIQCAFALYGYYYSNTEWPTQLHQYGPYSVRVFEEIEKRVTEAIEEYRTLPQLVLILRFHQQLTRLFGQKQLQSTEIIEIHRNLISVLTEWLKSTTVVVALDVSETSFRLLPWIIDACVFFRKTLRKLYVKHEKSNFSALVLTSHCWCFHVINHSTVWSEQSQSLEQLPPFTIAPTWNDNVQSITLTLWKRWSLSFSIFFNSLTGIIWNHKTHPPRNLILLLQHVFQFLQLLFSNYKS